MTKEEFDTTSTKQLVCPYCGEEQEDAGEAENLGESEIFTCYSCTRDFVYSTETYLLYTSEDLEEHFSDRLMQEKLWVAVLQKDLDSNIPSPENAERTKRNIKRCEDRIAKYQEALKNYKLQKPELLPNVIEDL